MRTIEAVRRSGVDIEREKTVREAAEIMDQTGVGSLAVIDGTDLVGIVTDRDVVRRALARGLPPDARVDTIMSAPVVSIGADADLHHAFGLFRDHGIRRLAVLREGHFVGMITVDDVLVDLANDLADLTRPISSEIERPHRNGTVPVARPS